MKKKFWLGVLAVSCLVIFGTGTALAEFQITDAYITDASDVGEFDINTVFTAGFQIVDSLTKRGPDHTTVQAELWYNNKKLENVVFTPQFDWRIYRQYNPGSCNFESSPLYQDCSWTYNGGTTAWQPGLYIFKVSVEGEPLTDYALYYVGPRYNLPEPGKFVKSWTDEQSGEGGLYVLFEPANGFMQGSLGFDTIIWAEVKHLPEAEALGTFIDTIPGHLAWTYYPASLIKFCEKNGATGFHITVYTATDDNNGSTIRRRVKTWVDLPG